LSDQVGRYQLLRKLATGGMAEVFLARASWPMGFKKTLVLKRILPHLAGDPRFVEMFLSEARLAAQLSHPHIVQIFEFGEDQGQHFLVMEYIDGPSLHVLIHRALKKGFPLPPAVCARLVADACEALAFAHDFADPETGQSLGLVHRDISPDNILLTRQGNVKVVDFGIAKAAGQHHRTKTGIIKGKLPYMAPEQVRAQPLDRRVDVYALGAVLYQLLTGSKPFDAPEEAALMRAILFDPLVPAVKRRPDLPKALQEIVEMALARDPKQRYPDCTRFQTALEEFILSQGKPVSAHQVARLITRVSSGGGESPPESASGTTVSRQQEKPRRGRARAMLLVMAVSILGCVVLSWGMISRGPWVPSEATADPHSVERPRSPQPPEVGKGSVEFRIRPYATIFLDGKRLGETPLPPIEKPAGRYTVKVVNTALSKTVTQNIEVSEGQTTRVNINLF
jgi:serine/threonine protein kinase